MNGLGGQRVVVTGVGAVGPFGAGANQLFDGVVGGACAIRAIDAFDAGAYPTRVAAALPVGFDFSAHLPRKLLRMMDPFQALGMIAALEAFRDSGAKLEELDSYRGGLWMGSCLGQVEAAGAIIDTVRMKGWRKLSPYGMLRYQFSGIAVWPGINLGLRGPSVTVGASTASSLVAIGRAAGLIRVGEADRMLAGGADSIQESTLALLIAYGLLAPADEGAAATVARPFDRERTGAALGEGGAALALESEASARERGARVRAEILGFGCAFDPAEDPAERGEGLEQAMRGALEDAGLSASDIELVSADASGCPIGDAVELRALDAVLGERARQIPVVSPRGHLGHALGAAPALQTVLAILGSEAGLVTPTIGFGESDLGAEFDHVPGEARELVHRTILVNGFGLDGQAAALVLRVGAPD